MLTDEQIKKFQRLYYDTFNRRISRAEATEYGTAFVQLVGAIYRPIRKSEREKFMRRRKKNHG